MHLILESGKNYNFRPSSVEQSHEVQQALFDLGYEWLNSGRNLLSSMRFCLKKTHSWGWRICNDDIVAEEYPLNDVVIIKLTEADIGRKVILRNGSVYELERNHADNQYYQDGFIFQAGCATYRPNGSTLPNGSLHEKDIVSFSKQSPGPKWPPLPWVVSSSITDPILARAETIRSAAESKLIALGITQKKETT